MLLSPVTAAASSLISAADFRSIVKRKALVPVSDDTAKQMAQNGCAKNLDRAAFEKYWTSSAATGSSSSTRRSCDGRSLKEIDLLLSSEEKENAGGFSAEEAAGFQRFFSNLKPD